MRIFATYAIWLQFTLLTLFAFADEEVLPGELSNPPQEIADASLSYLNELTNRRRINRLHPNRQSPFYGVRIGYVNASRGNLTFVNRDLVRIDRLPLVLGRVYDSQIQHNNDFGRGWKLTVAETLTYTDQGYVYADASNSQYLLSKSDDSIRSVYSHITGIVDGTLEDEGRSAELNLLGGMSKIFERSPDGYRIVSVRDSHGNQIHVRYNRYGVHRIDSSNGRFVEIRRDKSSGRVVGMIDDLGNTVAYQYDKNDQLIGFIDRGGNEWRYQYSKTGLLERIRDPEGRPALKVHYDQGGTPGAVEVYGVADKFEFSDRAATVETVDGIAKFQAHESGLTQRIDDVTGRALEIEFDSELRPIRLLGDGESLVEVSRDSNGNAIRVERRFASDSHTIEFGYNDDGRIISILRDGTSHTNIHYGPRNGVAIVDGDGNHRAHARNEFGDVTEITFSGERYSLDYDEAGLLHSVSAGTSPVVRFERNDDSRITAAKWGDGVAVFYEYNKVGFRVASAVRDGLSTRFSYDASGNLIAIGYTDKSGMETKDEYVVDSYNRLKAIKTDGSGNFEFAYDNAGRLKSASAANRILEYEYDNFGRVIAAKLDGDTTFVRSYDEVALDGAHLADTTSGITWVNLPNPSNIFGSVWEMRLLHIEGMPYSPLVFDPDSRRFAILPDILPHPDVKLTAAFPRIHIFDDAQSRAVDFSKPSNPLLIPPEYYSVNCGLCTIIVAGVELTVDSQNTELICFLTQVNVLFEVVGDLINTCKPWDFQCLQDQILTPKLNNVQFGDGASAASAGPSGAYNHVYEAPGDREATGNVIVLCDSPFARGSDAKDVRACDPDPAYDWFSANMLWPPDSVNLPTSGSGSWCGSGIVTIDAVVSAPSAIERDRFIAAAESAWEKVFTSCFGVYRIDVNLTGSIFSESANLILEWSVEPNQVPEGGELCGLYQLNGGGQFSGKDKIWIVNDELCDMNETAAHEFGHAFGFPNDNLPYVDPTGIMRVPHDPVVPRQVKPYHARLLLERHGPF